MFSYMKIWFESRPLRHPLISLILLRYSQFYNQICLYFSGVYGHFGNGPPLKETRRCGVARRFCAIVSQALFSGPSFRCPERL